MRSLACLFLAVALTACGGGSADTPAPVPAPAPTPIASTPPACVPRLVSVALVGDSTQYGWDTTTTAQALHNPGAQLQADMDAQFGAGAVLVTDYGVLGSTAAQAPKVTADVIAANYGINDARTGVPLADYVASMQAIGATLIETPNPTFATPDRAAVDVAPFAAAGRALGLPVADVTAYMLGRPDWQSLLPDGMHPSEAGYTAIVDNVLAPAVAKQVAPLRCVTRTIQLFGDSTQWLAAPYWQKHYPGQVESHAVPGTSTAQLLAGTDGQNLAWPAPVSADFVVVKFGANDALPWFNTPVDQFKANLRELLRGIKGTPVLETPDPTLDVNRPNEPEYTQAVRDVAAEAGVALIDTDVCWKARAGGWADLIGPDTEHATEAGRAFTVETCVAPVIDRLLSVAH